jgi:hypothetical protein
VDSGIECVVRADIGEVTEGSSEQILKADLYEDVKAVGAESNAQSRLLLARVVQMRARMGGNPRDA